MAHFIINFIIQSALPTTVDAEIWPKALQACEQQFAKVSRTAKQIGCTEPICVKNKLLQMSK